jgi:hypothetical protein
MLFSPSENVMSVRAVQCSNAYCPMEETDPGITTLSREGHSRNAWAPMSEVPSGITMDLRFAAWLNALSSMVPILPSKIICSAAQE